ncbi:DUF3006 family protein [Natrinema longum]|uniref:DUF3006 family protein n=1 Tax=Natrinema longum TaxID=370324 RepID=A0A8A2UB03_9EURY|nr:DUF3006 family protein [Natrinema longum]MBZ6496081.1 DUF3006 domain-containing protein [Natrinema longum]QSW85991.1 DUF3006 family protein [Natrinema longum]
MSDTQIGVVDRIVDETAVLLLEDDGDVVDEQLLALERLPEDGRHEGAVFETVTDAGTVRETTYRADIERERRESTRERFDRLSERLSDRDRTDE